MSQFRLKVVTNKQKTKVLYAEADSEFVDVLLSFLTLPLGTIVRVLQKHDPSLLLGSLTTLYKGLASLDSVYFETGGGKQMLLNPRSSSESARHKLKLNLDDTDQPIRYFRCAKWDCNFSANPYVSIFPGIPITCNCGKSTLSRQISINDPVAQDAADGVGGVFAMRTAHFIISDDLQLLPSVTVNAITVLSNLGITDTDGTELMDVTLGFKEIMDLLKASLLSETPLTDIVLSKRNVDSLDVKYGMGAFVPPIEKRETCNTKKYVVKAILQKSTNKLICVEGDAKFVEFLFSVLTIPLGGIEHLLGGNTKLKNIDNLYRTLGDINGDIYLRTQCTKTKLLNPKLPHGYTSKNDLLLPLIEESPRVLYFYQDNLYPSTSWERTTVRYKSPKGLGYYVKGPTMFLVTDDLVVTPLFTTSSLSFLNRLKVPLSDVRDLEVNVGLEEALSILRASLTSTRALSDGLANLIFEKQPKQEQRG